MSASLKRLPLQSMRQSLLHDLHEETCNLWALPHKAGDLCSCCHQAWAVHNTWDRSAAPFLCMLRAQSSMASLRDFRFSWRCLRMAPSFSLASSSTRPSLRWMHW